MMKFVRPVHRIVLRTQTFRGFFNWPSWTSGRSENEASVRSQHAGIDTSKLTDILLQINKSSEEARAEERKANDERRKEERKADDESRKSDKEYQFKTTIFSVVVGSAVSLGVTWSVERGKQEAKAKKEAENVDSQALRVMELLDAALAELREARKLFLANHDPILTSYHLNAALRLSESIDAFLNEPSFSRFAIMTRLTKKHSVTESTILNLRAHIAYHMSALQLLDEDVDSDMEARHLLAESMALRVQANTRSTNQTNFRSELARTHIKYADVLSRQNQAGSAMQMYESLDFVGTFWDIRATNNKAILRFARGEDSAALHGMLQVVAKTKEWFDLKLRAFSPDERATLLKAIPDLAAFANGGNPNPTNFAQFISLVNFGEDDVVDVLHLPTSPGRLGGLTTRVTADNFSTQKDLALECIELTTLLIRKYYTSRANCVLCASTPYSQAMNSATKECDLIYLVEAMFDDPFATDSKLQQSNNAGLELFSKLDGKWLQHEGVARLYSAMGLALVKFASDCPKDSELRARLLEKADEITKVAIERNTQDLPPLPNVHGCMSIIARARYLEESGRAGDALKLLQSNESLSNSYLQWSIQSQKNARARSEEEPSKSPFKRMPGVEPRVTRWQATVIAYALNLDAPPTNASFYNSWRGDAVNSWRGDAATELRYAVNSMRNTQHPLKQVVHGSRSPCCTATSISREDEERLHAVLDKLPKWREYVESTWRTKANSY